MTAIFLVFIWSWDFTELLFYLLLLTWWAWPLTSLGRTVLGHVFRAVALEGGLRGMDGICFSLVCSRSLTSFAFFFPITHPPAEIKDLLHKTRCPMPVFPSCGPKQHHANLQVNKILRVCNHWHEGDHGLWAQLVLFMSEQLLVMINMKSIQDWKKYLSDIVNSISKQQTS